MRVGQKGPMKGKTYTAIKKKQKVWLVHDAKRKKPQCTTRLGGGRLHTNSMNQKFTRHAKSRWAHLGMIGYYSMTPFVDALPIVALYRFTLTVSILVPVEENPILIL